MANRKPWDVTSTDSLEAFAEFARKKADASVVLIVRGEDYAFAPAQGVLPAAAREAVEFVLPGAVELAEMRAKEEREAATRKRAAAIAGRK